MSRIIIACTIKEPIAYFDNWKDVGKWLERNCTIQFNEYCFNGSHIHFKTLYI